MAELAELAVPVVSTAAGFQRHLAGGQLREILQYPLTSECLADYHTPAPVDPVQLEDLLRDIQTDSCNLHAWTLLQFSSMACLPSLAHYEALEHCWVHPINESLRTVVRFPVMSVGIEKA